jgi:hypothetical protein
MLLIKRTLKLVLALGVGIGLGLMVDNPFGMFLGSD